MFANEGLILLFSYFPDVIPSCNGRALLRGSKNDSNVIPWLDHGIQEKP
ncbi:MAG: hypothetical protein LN573_02735 [Rickettsia endosymbiont of Oxypoda opaca]|nr:hypothetical protein [Rickettsia endosymbiont of Oxypoda opaca]